MGADTVNREAPEGAAAAAELLRACADAGTAVRIAGGGTKRAWGHAVPEAGTVLATEGLGALIEHNRGDLTAIVGAGMTLRELDALLEPAGQMLALDPPLGDGEAATVGGVVAAGDSGPLRHRYGAPRDLVLGITVALSDGSLAKAGGKVIKNVAGYDLAKLFSGSFGTLGLIVELAVRLHPRPPAVATATGTTDEPGRLQEAAIALSHSSLEAQSLDVRWEEGRGTVLARFAGAAAADQVAAAERALDAAGVDAATVADDAELWAGQRAAQRSAGAGAVVRVSGRPSGLAAACAAAGAAGATLAGRAAFGLWWIALPPAPDGELADSVAALRERLAPAPGVVLDAPARVRAALDPWDHPDGPEQELMRRVKRRFDPTATCNPGLFVGGI